MIKAASRTPLPYSLPTEIEGDLCKDAPLYIAIAYWAVQRESAVTVSDVRKKFKISMRRASDLLEYLTGQGAAIIEAECYLLPQPAGCRLKRRAWRVFGIDKNVISKYSTRY